MHDIFFPFCESDNTDRYFVALRLNAQRSVPRNSRRVILIKLSMLVPLRSWKLPPCFVLSAVVMPTFLHCVLSCLWLYIGRQRFIYQEENCPVIINHAKYWAINNVIKAHWVDWFKEFNVCSLFNSFKVNLIKIKFTSTIGWW